MENIKAHDLIGYTASYHGTGEGDCINTERWKHITPGIYTIYVKNNRIIDMCWNCYQKYFKRCDKCNGSSSFWIVHKKKDIH